MHELFHYDQKIMARHENIENTQSSVLIKLDGSFLKTALHVGRYLLSCIGTRFKGMLLTMTWYLILLSLVCETMKKGKRKSWTLLCTKLFSKHSNE